MQVLDDHDERELPAAGEPELAERLEGAGLDRVGRERPEPLGAVVDPEQVQQVRPALGRIHPGLAQRDAHALAHRRRRVRIRDRARGPEDAEHRQVRRRRAVRHAPGRQTGHRLSGDALAELVEEARLADARLTAEPHDVALAADGGLEPAPEQLDLAVTPHERRDVAGHAEAAALASRERKEAPERAPDEVEQLEVALEERRRGLADEDRSRLAAVGELLEHAERLLLRLQIQLRGAAARPDEELGEMNPDLGRRQRHPVAPRPLERALHRHRGMRGSARRVLDGLEPERGDDAGGTHPLDAPAEAPRLLHEDLERAARVELDVGPDVRHQRRA